VGVVGVFPLPLHCSLLIMRRICEYGQWLVKPVIVWLEYLDVLCMRFWVVSWPLCTLCHGDSDRSGKAGKEASYEWG